MLLKILKVGKISGQGNNLIWAYFHFVFSFEVKIHAMQYQDDVYFEYSVYCLCCST